MIRILPPTIAERLRDHNQEHLLRGWERLSPAEQVAFGEQIEKVDLELVSELFESTRSPGRGEVESAADRAARARPCSRMIRLPRNAAEKTAWDRAAQTGEDLLRNGKVGVLLVAGGQGTRLGFEHAKGMYPIGPVEGTSLFQILAEQVLARTRRAGVAIPYYIMTSDATHEETVDYFDQKRYFGLGRENVYFFRQGTMPAVDSQTGQLLLAGPGRLATSPDGHGGVLTAMAKANILNDMRDRGIEYIYYHQVDNPMAIICDPVFLGFHVLENSEVSTKVVAKTDAREKMGVVAEVDGTPQIIEYSDLPAEAAERTTADGQLEFWAGNTAMHVFSRSLFERLTCNQLNLPFHLAHKAVPHLNADGHLSEPATPNAYKFERFIFDVLPIAGNTLVLEADRAREFNPLKNATGPNSAEDVKSSLCALHRGWLNEAGANIADDVPVEISPLFALDAAEAVERFDPAKEMAGPETASPLYLGDSNS